ncbi:MAG: hypothetical protein U5M23_06260 [Marinagarivorans sp.]|nr:hypothetical protein [Marinagarivorans sp.]
MSFKFVFIISALAISTLNGCSKDDEFIDSNCDGFSYQKSNAPESVNVVVERLIPKNSKVNCYESASITSQGHSADVIVIEYGEPKDCISGCFSSVLCAVLDNEGASIYTASWTSKYEMPPSLNSTCMPTNDGDGNSKTACSTPPSGYSHPITTTSDFANLLNNESSTFRHCK